MKVNISSNANPFLTGLVFGFDVGTGSIGYAVRKGADFKDVGVLICDSEGGDLSKRRDLRRQFLSGGTGGPALDVGPERREREATPDDRGTGRSISGSRGQRVF